MYIMIDLRFYNLLTNLTNTCIVQMWKLRLIGNKLSISSKFIFLKEKSHSPEPDRSEARYKIGMKKNVEQKLYNTNKIYTQKTTKQTYSLTDYLYIIGI